MTDTQDKENIAPSILEAVAPVKMAAITSPTKPAKKSRSKSIGPGGLDALKEDTGNRRKSAFIPAVKSILQKDDAEKEKQRAERRKSMANRRVSFAPEATLHTWNVIEYMRDSTTSSASSNSTRRVSQSTVSNSPQANLPSSDALEPPSSPHGDSNEETVKETPTKETKKPHRRSSGIPPMNFNNPDDVMSSSPAGASSDDGIDGVDMDNESTAMSLDGTEVTGQSIGTASEAGSSTSSSARLEEALRQAAVQAGTNGIDFDENGDATMEIADEEITAAFKPWTQRGKALRGENTPLAQLSSDGTFSPAAKAHVVSQLAEQLDDESEGEDMEEMTMEMTRAVGGIIASQQSPASAEDVTMDLTMAVGGIQNKGVQGSNIRKRRISQASQQDDSLVDDATMEFTVAVGGIQKHNMPVVDDRDPTPTKKRRVCAISSFDEDGEMEFTAVVGGIRAVNAQIGTSAEETEDEHGAEDMSMELTTAVGDIKYPSLPGVVPEGPATPLEAVIVQEAKVTTPKDQTRFKAVEDVLPVPTPEILRPSPAKATPQKAATPLQFSASRQKPASIGPKEAATPTRLTRRQSASRAAMSPAVTKSGEGTPNRSLSTLTPRKLNFGAMSTPLKAPSVGILSPLRRVTASARKSPHALASRMGAPTPLRNVQGAFGSPARRTPKATPKKLTTPRKQDIGSQQAASINASSPAQAVSRQPVIARICNAESVEAQRIPLQQFLDMTNIRFMELTTTKRRHTVAPSKDHDDEDGADVNGSEPASLESLVIAGASTLPMFELYHHSCRELKHYISEGRELVRQIEAATNEDNPTLFREYLSAPPEQRSVMENQFKNMKTNARLRTKAIWYDWRSKLLDGVKEGLLRNYEELKADESYFSEQEGLIESVLPGLVSEHEELVDECTKLQAQAEEMAAENQEELAEAREALVAVTDDVAEKSKLLAQLREQLLAKEASIEAIQERKEECLAEIKEAERVKEECRGWSVDEVTALKRNMERLESTYGWTIVSAASEGVTMAYRNQLQLFFNTASFLADAGAIGAMKSDNSPISLTYIADAKLHRPEPLTTEKRFFLQLTRAHLHSMVQARTTVKELLSFVSSSWDKAVAVAKGIRTLDLDYATEANILGDEMLGLETGIFLRSLQTKVRISLELNASIQGNDLQLSVVPKASVIYGERYNELRMSDFLSSKIVGTQEYDVWADAVRELKGRLIARGRKA